MGSPPNAAMGTERDTIRGAHAGPARLQAPQSPGPGFRTPTASTRREGGGGGGQTLCGPGCPPPPRSSRCPRTRAVLRTGRTGLTFEGASTPRPPSPLTFWAASARPLRPGRPLARSLRVRTLTSICKARKPPFSPALKDEPLPPRGSALPSPAGREGSAAARG